MRPYLFINTPQESLRGVYGHDQGLSQFAGFNETALFRLHMNGPSQTPFNFGDSYPDIDNSAAMYFMGYAALPTSSLALRRLCAYEGRRLARLIAGYAGAGEVDSYDCTRIDCARLLLDYSAAGSHADLLSQPRARVFRLSAFGWDGRAAVGFFRSGWSTDKSGVTGKEAWLAFKAANGVPNHNDLDGGSFVMEMGGQRWASDLGGDNYQLRGYFTQTLDGRYGYYRKSTAGHNTLTFNNNGADWAACDQDPGMSGISEITLFHHDSEGHGSTSPAYAIVDLTPAYAKPLNASANRIQRGFAFTRGFQQLLVVDEIAFQNGQQSIVNVTWTMHTLAKIHLYGASAVLSLGGSNMHVSVLEPPMAVLSAAAVDLQPPQKASTGVSKLMVKVNMSDSRSSGFMRIIVRLTMNADVSTPETIPLAEWKVNGPFKRS